MPTLYDGYEEAAPTETKPPTTDHPPLRWTDRINLFFTCMVAVAACAQVVVSQWQWASMEAALERADEQNQLTRESNETLRVTTASTVRAWILLAGPPQAVAKPDISADIVFNVRVRNAGQVPAFNFRSATNWGISDAEVPADCSVSPWSITALRLRGYAFGAIVAPGEPVVLDLPRDQVAFDLSAEQRQAMLDAYPALVVRGLICYDDPAGKDRATHWCAFYSPSDKRFQFCEDENSVR